MVYWSQNGEHAFAYCGKVESGRNTLPVVYISSILRCQTTLFFWGLNSRKENGF
jgi:hypothetical protein